MSADERIFVGVDVGGTKILALVVTAAGEVLAREKTPTAHDGTPMARQIGEAVDAAIDEAGLSAEHLAGIGVAMPGSVDSTTGYLGSVPNIDIDDHRFVDSLRERYPVPVEVGNDVNLGTLAECWLGAGRDAQTVVGMFVGTGIGGGVVIDGRLRTGPEDLAGEIGHMVMMVDGPECGCGNLGCFEALASRTAMEKAIRDGLAEGRESVIFDYAGEGRIKSGALRDALNDDDELVTEVMTRACHVLAQGVLTLRHVLDPDMVVMGGGVVEACEQFMMPLIEREVRASQMKGSRDTLRLAVSTLGDDAVALGAAALVEASISDTPVYEMQEESGEAPAAAEDDEQAAPVGSMLAAAVEELEAVDYPRIDEIEFGQVTVDGDRLDHDIHIRANGKLKKRKKKWGRKDHGTSHVVGPRELKKALKKGAEVLIIGEGFDGMLRLADEGREMLDQRGVRWQIVPTPDAPEAFEEAEGRKALILHVTC
jgi:glucokinase